jgi:hypothetical protein
MTLIFTDIRLFCFEITDKFFTVQQSKSVDRYIRCDISYLEYEALFKSDQWLQSEESRASQEREAMKDFVEQQTIDVDP